MGSSDIEQLYYITVLHCGCIHAPGMAAPAANSARLSSANKYQGAVEPCRNIR